MTERENLIALLREAIHLRDGICRVVGSKRTEEIADYLIAHGATIPVRCKDCRHWIERTADGVDSFHVCWFNGSITARNHFCVYGERKDNG